MRIAIDARVLEREMTGIGRVLKATLNELPRVDKKNEYYLFSYGDIENIDKKYFKCIKTIKGIIPQKIFSPIWFNFILPLYLKKNNIELFYSINQVLPLIKIKGIKYIFVLHDVIYKVDKTFHPFIYRTYLQLFTYFSIKSSDLVITVSDFSKQDILKYYRIKKEKVKVVYPAIADNFECLNLTDQDKENIRDKYNLPEKIILFVGVIENRKNIKGLLKVANEVYKKDPGIKFVLIGKIGYGGEKLYQEIIKSENILWLGKVDEQYLKIMYNISSIFLFPSLYEGFGFPPLEAMKSGLPVISSDKTSLKEVLSDGGLLHDPDDIVSFVDDIFKLLNDKNFYQKIREHGIERAKFFNSANATIKLVNIFNSL